MYVIYLLAATLLAAAVDIVIMGAEPAASLLLWLLVIKVGFGSVWAFMGHYFNADMVAGYIGWPKGNPFQQEVAFANLGLGVCGILSFFFRGEFWLATITFATCFLVGAFSVHVRDRLKQGNAHPGNAGPVFYADIGVPLVMWALYFVK